MIKASNRAQRDSIRILKKKEMKCCCMNHLLYARDGPGLLWQKKKLNEMDAMQHVCACAQRNLFCMNLSCRHND